MPCKSVSEECRSTVLLNIASETCATEVSYKGVFPARSSRVSCSLQESHTRVIGIRVCVSQESVQNQLHRSVAQGCPTRASSRMILKRVLQKRVRQLTRLSHTS